MGSDRLDLTMDTQSTSNDDYIKSLSPIVQERVIEARERDEDGGESIVLLHGLEDGFIGTTRNHHDRTVAVYDLGLCLRRIMDDIRSDHPEIPDDELYLEAVDYWDANVIRSLPYMGEVAPVVIERFEVDGGLW